MSRNSAPALSRTIENSSVEHTHPMLDLKYALDLAVAGLGLFLLGPLLLLVAIAIRLDSQGPIIFKQTRTGLRGKPFQIYKFRTMNVLEDGNIVQQAVHGDKRVTRAGRWLRRTSVDELPQLINVIRGEMSLVGPRPHALAHDQYYGQKLPDYASRFAVRPGITGWAQVNGSRGETPTLADMQNRVELDLWYVNNWNHALDMKILIRTIILEASRQGMGH